MADEDWKSKVATGLIENVHILLIVLGAIFIFLGLSKGIHGIAIELPWARIVAIALGVLLIIAAAFALPYTKRLPDAESLKVKIQYPPLRSKQHNVVLRGTIAKTNLPKDYDLRAIKHYSKGAWAPIGLVRVNKDGNWESDQCSIGGVTGEIITVSICLAGPASKILINYFDQATSAHGAVLKNLAGPLPPGVAQSLPPIKETPPDLVPCATTEYERI